MKYFIYDKKKDLTGKEECSIYKNELVITNQVVISCSL